MNKIIIALTVVLVVGVWIFFFFVQTMADTTKNPPCREDCFFVRLRDLGYGIVCCEPPNEYGLSVTWSKTDDSYWTKQTTLYKREEIERKLERK